MELWREYNPSAPHIRRFPRQDSDRLSIPRCLHADWEHHMIDAWQSQGAVIVASAGTPVVATQNQLVTTTRCAAHSILFQQIAGNTGKIYICDRSNAVKATLVGVLVVLPIPTTNFLPSASATVTYSPSAFDLSNYYVDADVSNEGCLISIIRA